jgi:hypothetical protein
MQEEWMARANCIDVDPELFFTPAKENEAMEICLNCSVMGKCAAWARGNEPGIQDVYGVYAGLTAEMRIDGMLSRDR